MFISSGKVDIFLKVPSVSELRLIWILASVMLRDLVFLQALLNINGPISSSTPKVRGIVLYEYV